MDVKGSQTFPPVYRQSFQQAAERGEAELFQISQKLNIECAKAIDAALEKHFDENTCELNTAAASKEVVGKFGFDRTMTVLANSVRHYSWDGRFSNTIQDWARTIPGLDSGSINRDCLVTANAGAVDLFAGQVWYDHDMTRPLEAAEIKAEAEHILKQMRDIPEPNSPDRRMFMAAISPEFNARAKPEDFVKMVTMLPFPTTRLTTLPGHKGFFAVIPINEIQHKHQHLRKPSIKAQLAAKPVHGNQPAAKQRDREVR